MKTDRLDRAEPLDVVITDVTLREYGQNVPALALHSFSNEIRIDLALQLIQAGFRNLEVLSCAHPRIAPAMNEQAIRAISSGIGRREDVNMVTIVPSWVGYKTFLSAGLGPEGYNHTLGIFFSAVETHNLLNLGRTIEDTLADYEVIVRDALRRGITIAAYISAAFGYRPGPAAAIVRPAVETIGVYLDRLFEMGAATVTLSDLQGVADERQTRALWEGLLEKRDAEVLRRLGYHPHHVSGDRAIANTWAAYESGIRRFDASIGGTGGCVTGAPGNQPTEKLVEFFERQGIGTGVDNASVQMIKRFVEKEIYGRIRLVT
jgi:hydroxymethylglutaryl-CoA lyase